MEIHRELGKGHDETIYKDALLVELGRANIAFSREKKYEVKYKDVILPYFYFADFVVWDKILFEAKAIDRLVDSHLKQVLNYLAASNCGLVCWSTSAAIRWSGSELFYKNPCQSVPSVSKMIFR